jgi:hypothetical protein
MTDQDTIEAYRESREEALELLHSGQSECSHCGDIFPIEETLATATYGVCCYKCLPQ